IPGSKLLGHVDLLSLLQPIDDIPQNPNFGVGLPDKVSVGSPYGDGVDGHGPDEEEDDDEKGRRVPLLDFFLPFRNDALFSLRKGFGTRDDQNEASATVGRELLHRTWVKGRAFGSIIVLRKAIGRAKIFVRLSSSFSMVCSCARQTRGDAYRPTSWRRQPAEISIDASFPLQPRTLNRTATNIEPPPSKSPRCVAPPVSSACLALVECARVAFQCLRSLNPPDAPSQKNMQLEMGISAFVGKLLSLGLQEHALKELRILKKRLEERAVAGNNSKGAKATGSTEAPISGARVLSDLLDFKESTVTALTRSLVISTQLYVLRLMMLTKKPEQIEAATPFLRDSNKTSPLNLLLGSLRDDPKDAPKTARQIESLASIVLSLTPSSSSRDDIEAMEQRLSPSPPCTFELQIAALKIKMHFWRISKHVGDVDRDILTPFSRYLAALGRRLKPVSADVHELSQTAFLDLQAMTKEQGLTWSETSKSPAAAVYQSLASSAFNLKRPAEARDWAQKLYGLLDIEKDSAARRCSVAAHLLAASLKCKLDEPKLTALLAETIDGMQGTLRGESAELDQLLVDLALARRSAVGLLMSASDPKSKLSPALTELLQSFIIQYPRFTMRWLGKAPAHEGGVNTKEFLRFESRRQAVQGTLGQMLDSALVITKTLLGSSTVDWTKPDGVLQDCLGLLERMGDLKGPLGGGSSGNSYYVKISNLYYMKYALLRQSADNADDLTPLRSLRRSLDAIRNRSPKEQEAGQFVTKLERFADICTKFRRIDEARESLKSICTAMVEEGVLSQVATLLNEQPPSMAWPANDKSTLFSRTLRSIAKLDKTWNDWTFFMPEVERAAVLEHIVHFITSGENSKIKEPLKLTDAPVDTLLRIYSLEKFPVRRLRTLIHLYSMHIANPDHSSSLRGQIDVAMQAASGKSLGEDAKLVRYLPHFAAYLSSVSSLIHWAPNSPDLAAAITSWHKVISSSASRAEILNHVDDPVLLMTHLRALADLASMKGESALAVSVLELLADMARKLEDSALDEVVANSSLLANQYASLGYVDKAEAIIDATRAIAGQVDKVSGSTIADFHLAVADYCITTGRFDKAETCLAEAKEAFASLATKHAAKSRMSSLMAMANLLYSIIAVKIMFHDWNKYEKKDKTPAPSAAQIASFADSLGPGVSNLDSVMVARVVQGSEFWALASPLIRALLRLSALYAHMGMFQDTLYYAEQAYKVAENSGSALYVARSAVWTGSVWIKGGRPEKGIEYVANARAFVTENPHTSQSVALACQLSELYRLMGDSASEEEMLQLAESNVKHAGRAPGRPALDDDIAKDMEKLSLADKKPKVARSTRAKAPAPAKKPVTTVAKRVPAARGRKEAAPKPVPVEDDARTSLMKASILLYRALGHIHQKDWASASSVLEGIKGQLKGLEDVSREQMIRAACLVGQSLDDMIHDPVFSVVQESTISYPSVSLVKRADDKASPAKPAPVRKGAKARSAVSFVDALKEAQEYLINANATAVIRGDGGSLHRISSLLQSTVIFLSATKSDFIGHPGYATCAVELARNITWRRERKALQVVGSAAKMEWPVALASTGDGNRSSLGATTDISRFQKDYIDIIPSSWTVVSISPSDNREDLCITRLQAGHTPFVLRLPLERANSRDADNEVFSFQHGMEELRELIRLANKNSHDARDMTIKGAKAAWWEEREMLDERFKLLLDNIESVWLGGFKGVFSQHTRRPDLLARFQKSFQNMLDKHLPSRRQVRGKRSAKTPKITFDPRILELFVGLGGPIDDDLDYEEALTDLLYFTIDILQFHGEQNAYDEIDFDSMVVDTVDALAAYHQGVHAADDKDGSNAHTILVLDKSLHAFPWESLPCMQGTAVSRVPSLACLRRLIIEQQPGKPVTMNFNSDGGAGDGSATRPGHHVSPSSGTYILNPGGDLTNTLAAFQKPLEGLGASWTGVVGRTPTEDEFERALTESDLMLYFGHGSGAQYIRGKTIRRMDKCRAAVLLMGCSSASLEAAGEFECYGTVWNYMLSGAPAVVGALWDVTDREADRFAGKVFEEWGLMEAGTFKEGEGDKSGRSKGKGKGKAKEAGEGSSEERGGFKEGCSLVEAVGRARDACRFKYLTSAAMCVYGIPVYINRDGRGA
ncbi:unnamed protein product, partial [Parascedosporium putredinis]